MTEQILKKEFRDENVLAMANEKGLYIWSVNGWTVPISIAAAKQYVSDYSAQKIQPNVGFCDVSNGVVLTHNGAKFTFTKPEAIAIVDLINDAINKVWV